MSYDGSQTFLFAPLPAKEKASSYARKLLEREDREELIKLTYEFGYGKTHHLSLAVLDKVVKAPWKVIEAEPTSEVRTLAAADVVKLFATCAIMSKRLDALAKQLTGVIKNGGDEIASVRELLGDPDNLVDEREADRDVLRVAQLFAALCRGLRLAKGAEDTLIAVQRIAE